MTVSEKLQVLKETYLDGKEFVLVVDKLLDSALSEHRLRLAHLTTYPHHLHDGSEDHVLSHPSVKITDILTIIRQLIT